MVPSIGFTVVFSLITYILLFAVDLRSKKRYGSIYISELGITSSSGDFYEWGQCKRIEMFPKQGVCADDIDMDSEIAFGGAGIRVVTESGDKILIYAKINNFSKLGDIIEEKIAG